MQFWSPHHAKDKAKLGAVERKATKIIPSLRNKSYEERLARLYLFSLEKRRFRGKFIEYFKVLKGFTNVDSNKQVSIDELSRTRSKGIKLRYRKIELDNTKLFFTNDIVRKWNKLPSSVAQCITVNSLRNKVDHHLLQQGL